jgi:hypothetical protein
MTDLGFGLADRRSVIVILFTLLLSSIIFGFPFPIDTSNIVNLFIGLSLLTGFIYLARTICRFLLIAGYFIFRLPFDLFSFTKSELRARKFQEQDTNNKKTGMVTFVSAILRHSFTYSYGNAIVKPFLASDWGWKNTVPDSWKYYKHSHNIFSEWGWDLPILGIFDRLCLIGIGIIACIPSFGYTRDIGGYLGMGMLILLYVITGHFSFVIKDAFKKSEEDHSELVEAARSYPDVVYTKEARTYYGNDR